MEGLKATAIISVLVRLVVFVGVLAGSTVWAQTTDPSSPDPTLTDGPTDDLISLLGDSTGLDSSSDDPANIFMGGPGCTPTVGGSGCHIYQNEVNAFGPNSLTMYGNGGKWTALTPFYLILGMPNTSTNTYGANYTLPNVTLSSPATPCPTTGVGTPAPPISNCYQKLGYEGTYGPSFSKTPNDVYNFLHLTTVGPTGSASESLTNWQTWDKAVNGITANSFSIYLYLLWANLGGHGTSLTVNFTNASIPKGTFAVGFACGAPSCSSSPNPYTTPFTEAGLQTSQTPPVQTPEPTSVMELGLALFGLVLVRRKIGVA